MAIVRYLGKVLRLGIGKILRIFPPSSTHLALELTFDSLTNASGMIGGSVYDVSVWNTFFNLPTNGNPFTSVVLDASIFDASIFYDNFETYNDASLVGQGGWTWPGLYNADIEVITYAGKKNIINPNTVSQALYSISNLDTSLGWEFTFQLNASAGQVERIYMYLGDAGTYCQIGSNYIYWLLETEYYYGELEADFTYNDGDVFKFVLDGSSFRCYKNDVIDTNWYDYNDGGYDLYGDQGQFYLLTPFKWGTSTDLRVYWIANAGQTQIGDIGLTYNINSIVKLYGGSNITVPDSLFSTDYDGYGHLISIVDDVSCIVAAGYNSFGDYDVDTNATILETAILPALVTAGNQCFWWCPSLNTVNFNSLVTAGNGCFDYQCGLSNLNFPLLTNVDNGCFNRNPNLISVNFPNVTNIGDSCFNDCPSLNSIYLPKCTSLGTTIGDDNVFFVIVDLSINLTIPAALMTCNSGQPDGDIQYLIANNTVTIVTISDGSVFYDDFESYTDGSLAGQGPWYVANGTESNVVVYTDGGNKAIGTDVAFNGYTATTLSGLDPSLGFEFTYQIDALIVNTEIFKIWLGNSTYLDLYETQSYMYILTQNNIAEIQNDTPFVAGDILKIIVNGLNLTCYRNHLIDTTWYDPNAGNKDITGNAGIFVLGSPFSWDNNDMLWLEYSSIASIGKIGAIGVTYNL